MTIKDYITYRINLNIHSDIQKYISVQIRNNKDVIDIITNLKNLCFFKTVVLPNWYQSINDDIWFLGKIIYKVGHRGAIM